MLEEEKNENAPVDNVVAKTSFSSSSTEDDVSTMKSDPKEAPVNPVVPFVEETSSKELNATTDRSEPGAGEETHVVAVPFTIKQNDEEEP